jgi:hypothetical protein
MARFDLSIQTAIRLIAKNGGAAKYKQPVKVTNPAKPWEQTTTIVEHDVTVCVLPMDGGSAKSIGYMKDSEVPAGAALCLMGTVDFDVDLTGAVVAFGKTYAIDKFTLLAPNGQKVLYMMALKQ